MTFAANAGAGTQACTNIPIIDDNLVENAEGFGLSASTTDGRVSFPSGTSASVLIADNDGKLHEAYRDMLCAYLLNSALMYHIRCENAQSLN